MIELEYEKLSLVDWKLGKAIKLIEQGRPEKACREIKDARTILMEGIF